MHELKVDLLIIIRNLFLGHALVRIKGLRKDNRTIIAIQQQIFAIIFSFIHTQIKIHRLYILYI